MSDTPAQPTRPVIPNEMEQMLSIREFEQRVDSLKTWIASQFTHVREVSDIEAGALTKALELQAVELSRRLEELNHAHKIAMENWARSLPREIFDAVMADWNKRWEQVLKAMSDGQQQAVNMADAVSRIRKLEEGFPKDAGSSIAMLQAEVQSAKGALSLIRWVGLAGGMIMLLSFLRMAKVIP